MAKSAEIFRSLYQITEWPLDLSRAIYQEYPFFKLGVNSSVQYYAERLTPFVHEIIAAKPKYSHWALTSPRFYRIPTAANLLCWAIYEQLKGQNGYSHTISVVNLSKERAVLKTAEDFSHYNNYSKYSWDERSKLISKEQFLIEADDFRNRGVIFIDDINVTGTKQENIRQVFANAYPDKINWLYIIDCDKSIGRREPQLESNINNFKIKSVFDFGLILAREDVRYTTKCISKLFTYSMEELEQLLGMLSPSQKSKLWAAILEEDLYQSDLFKAEKALVEAHARSK